MLNCVVKQWGKGSCVLRRSRCAVPSDLAVLPEKKWRGITAAVPPLPPMELQRRGEAVVVIMFNLF